jgi:cell division protein FtsI/penicillin-binding protein 2
MNRRCFIAVAAGPPLRATTTLEDSTARTLARMLPSDGFEYLLLSIKDRTALAERWIDAARPAPLGSLVKPFLAIAYGEPRAFEFPRVRCEAGQCWLASGHGEMTIEKAIAHSCNAYFTELARNVSPESLSATAQRYAISIPEVISPETLIGRYGTWKSSPSEIAAAYAELAERRSDPGVRTVMRGMRLCAETGTASGARARIAAKTGTAPCHHAHASTGDGLVAALFPEHSPEYVLIVRGHGVPGAEVARATAAFFRALNHAR